MQVQGYLEDIKEKQTKVGAMYDLKVNGDYYGIGKYPPRDAKAGDYVEFVMEQNGNFRNVGRGTLRVIPAPAGASRAAPSAPTKQSTGGGWDERQATISKQAALNTAIAFVTLATANDTIKLPATKGDQLGVLEAAVFEYAAKFHEFSTGVAVELPAVEPKPKARKKKAAEPDDEFEDSEWDDEG